MSPYSATASAVMPAPVPEAAQIAAVPITPAQKMNVFAIVSFVVSLLGSHVIAVVLGHVALAQIARAGEGGRGFAIAGLIIGYVTFAFSVVLFAVWVVLVFSYGAASPAAFSNS